MAVGACWIFEDFDNHGDDIFYIDRLKHSLAAANERKDRGGTNEVCKTLNERSILSEENRWPNDSPIQATIDKHLFGQIAALHIAARLVRFGTQPTDFNDAFYSCRLCCPNEIGGPFNIRLFVFVTYYLFMISCNKSSMYNRLYIAHGRFE